MGLKFRIFTKAEHYTMSSPAAALRKAAAASAAIVPASKAVCKYGDKCHGCNVCKKGGKGGGAQVAQVAQLSSTSAAPSPKPAVKGGDGCFSAQLAAMQKKLDQIEVKIDSGFEAQEKRSLALQEQGSKSYAETMQMFKAFGSMMTGGFTAINTAHRELPALLARPAICTGSRSTATEVVEIWLCLGVLGLRS